MVKNKQTNAQNSMKSARKKIKLIYIGTATVAWVLLLATIDISSLIDSWLLTGYSGDERTQIVTLFTWLALITPILASWVLISFLSRRDQIKLAKKSERRLAILCALLISVCIGVLVSIAAAYIFFAINFAINF